MLNDNNIIEMFFYILANLLKLNSFSEWSIVNKHSFTIMIGTFIWSILWQFSKTYTGHSMILKAIYTGFYYLVVADLYTFFMTSSSIYNNNIYNKNFHDLNYYGTLEMQPMKTMNKSTNKVNADTINIEKKTDDDIASEDTDDDSVDKELILTTDKENIAT